MLNLSNLELTRPERTIQIVDKHNEPTGLSLTIRAKTDDEYQKVQRQVQDQFSSPKKISAKKRRELFDRLTAARVSGWEWSGRAAEVSGNPEFNQSNLKSLLFENGEHSAAIREQLAEAVGEEDEAFIDE